MKILHVLDHSVPLSSGYSYRTLSILNQQRALGWQTAHVTSTKHYGAKSDFEHTHGLDFHRTLPTNGLLERLPILNQFEVIRSLANRLHGVIVKEQPDILHAHSPSLNGLAALWAARKHELPVVYELRALWEDGAVTLGTSSAGGLRYRLTRALETYCLRRADAVTTICEGLRGEIVSRGIPADRVGVIPNAVDVERFRMGRVADPVLAAQLGFTGCTVLGFIGSFYIYEGLDVLLEATARMLKRNPAVRVLLVGGGPRDEALRAQAQALGIADKVTFTGTVPHDKVQNYYDLIDIAVYPRHNVRLTDLVTPLKPLEAMAQGKLVVASDVGGHKELVEHDVTGVLFRAGDADSLAATLTQFIAQRERHEPMRQRARQFVERERTWRASVAHYAPIYQRLLERAR